jgi:hypothetical protein
MFDIFCEIVFGILVVLVVLFGILFVFHERKPTNEQVAACVLACKGHLTEMASYSNLDIDKQNNFTCHCKMSFKISQDGSTITDQQ